MSGAESNRFSISRVTSQERFQRTPRLDLSLTALATMANAAATVDPSGAGPRVEEIIRNLSDRGRCPVAAEKSRLTKCSCLSDLLRSHPAETTAALTLFLERFENYKSPESQSKFADKHIVLEKVGCDTAINEPANSHYLLPSPCGESSKSILLCRSAIIEITKKFTRWNWQATEDAFTPLPVLKRNRRRQAVMRILNYLLQKNFEPHQQVQWTCDSITRYNIPIDTAKKYTRKYDLRTIATDEVRCVVHWNDWLSTQFAGYQLQLPSALVQQVLPRIADRGRTAAGYHKVHPNSVGMDSTAKNFLVQYRTISFTNKFDKPIVPLLDGFKTQFATCLGVAHDDLTVESSYLKSPGFAPQFPHFDFHARELEKNSGKIYIAVTPLTAAGSYLQVWDKAVVGSAGVVLYVPYGTLLILPGDTLHGGGFQSCFESLDLRLHFYIYVKPCRGGIVNSNKYKTVEEFPMAPTLNVNGRLYAAFQSAQRRSNKD